MDAALNYSYANLELAFDKVKQGSMIRAVRIKNAVKEKVGRLYARTASASNVAPAISEVVSASVPTEEVVEKATYFDIDERTPFKPATFLSKCKVVLYTQKLRSKMERLYNKNAPMKEVEEPTEVIPVIEPVASIQNEVQSEEPKVEAPITPIIEPAPTQEEVTAMEGIVPDSWDQVFNNKPEVKEEVEPVVPPINKVEEPKDIDVNDFAKNLNETMIPEPTQVGTAEAPMDFTPMSESDLEKTLTFKIPQQEPLMPGLFEPVMESAVEDSAPTKTAIMAKVTRASNELKERNTRISELEGKVNTLESTIKSTSEKLSGYEAVIKNTVKENSRLTSENSQLQEANGVLKANYNALSTEYKETIASLNEKHNQELSSVKEEVVLTKTQYEERLARKDKEKEDEIARLKQQHAKDMNAVYATIAEVLGEPTETKEKEDDFEQVFKRVA